MMMLSQIEASKRKTFTHYSHSQQKRISKEGTKEGRKKKFGDELS
jgi:hypothetical protein